MYKLFTVGCSIHPIENFIELLRLHKVDCLADVRSIPFSAHTPQFNKDILSLNCRNNSISYVHMGKQFGAQREEQVLYSRDEKGYYVDFSKVAASAAFIEGIDRIMLGIQRGYSIALMCTEKDPIDCHRAILVARNFALRNVEIKHILFDGKLLTQAELDSRLVQRYKKNEDCEIDLFGDKVSENSDESYNTIADAYRRRGIEIAFRRDFL